MTHTTDQERAEFEAWYIAGARKSVPAFAEWSEIELREGCMRPDSGSYRIDYARIAWEAWQAARRAPVAQVLLKPDAYLVYAKGSTRYWILTLNPDDVPEIYKGGETVPLYRNAAAPQPPEAALVPSIAVTPEMVEAANEAYCPFGDMELALCAALQVAPIPPGVAPVQLPENIREGEPYDNPAFEALARALGVWGTAQSAVCAQFWIAAKEQST